MFSNDVIRFTASDTPDEILEKLTKASDEVKSKLKGDWAENLQQIAGFLKEQVTAAVTLLAAGLYDQTKDYEFVGTPFNVVMPFVNRYVSRVTHLFKEYQVLPGEDDADEDQALGDEKLLNARWQTSKMREATRRAIVFSCATSKGFVFTDADPTLDPQTIMVEKMDKKSGQPLLDDQFQPVLEKRILPQGDTVHWSLSALNVDLYPNEHGVQGSPVVAARVFMAEEDILRRFALKELPKDARKASTGNNKVDNLLGNERFLWEVVHLWLKKTPKRPQGAHYVLMGKTVIEKTEKDGKPWIGTWNNKVPLVEFSDGLQCGYWGRGRHTAAKPLVKDICIAWSTIAQIASMPGLMMAVPEDAILSEKLANLRLLIFEKPAGGDSVDWSSAPRMPLHEFVIERGIKQIGEIYSQHAVSRGEAPGSRFPAKGMEMLWKVDVMAETPTGQSYLEAFRLLGELELGEGRRVWPEKMVDAILGENGRFEKAAFYRGKVGGNVDVRVVPNKENEGDKDSLRKYIVEAGKAKLVDGATVRREFGKPSKEDMAEPMKLQENNAKDEEKRIEKGEQVPTQWFDDHVFHFQYHLRAGAKQGTRAEGLVLEARETHSLMHLISCPVPRLPEILPFVSADLQMKIKEMAATPAAGAAPPPVEGGPEEVPFSGGEPDVALPGPQEGVVL